MMVNTSYTFLTNVSLCAEDNFLKNDKKVFNYAKHTLFILVQYVLDLKTCDISLLNGTTNLLSQLLVNSRTIFYSIECRNISVSEMMKYILGNMSI